jgi:hypothetical protein
MDKKQKILRIILMVVFAIVTGLALFFVKNYLNFEMGENGSVANLAVILIMTLGTLAVFTWLPYSYKKEFYFYIGVAMILFSMMIFVHQNIFTISFIKETSLASYSVIDTVFQAFAGIFLMTYSWLKMPQKSYS